MKLTSMFYRSIAIAAFFAFPLLSFAGYGFYVANDTTYDGSYKAGTKCSTTEFGVAGLATKKSLSGINDTLTATLCGDAKTNCVMDVYMTKDCSGPTIATVTFDQDKGIVNLDIKKGTGFVVNKQSDRTVYVGGGPLPK